MMNDGSDLVPEVEERGLHLIGQVVLQELEEHSEVGWLCQGLLEGAGVELLLAAVSVP